MSESGTWYEEFKASGDDVVAQVTIGVERRRSAPPSDTGDPGAPEG